MADKTTYPLRSFMKRQYHAYPYRISSRTFPRERTSSIRSSRFLCRIVSAGSDLRHGPDAGFGLYRRLLDLPALLDERRIQLHPPDPNQIENVIKNSSPLHDSVTDLVHDRII